MKTLITFIGGPWNGRKESIELKDGERVSTLDVPCKDGFYARYVCQGGHDKGAGSVEVTYARMMSHDELTSTQKQKQSTPSTSTN